MESLSNSERGSSKMVPGGQNDAINAEASYRLLAYLALCESQGESDTMVDLAAGPVESAGQTSPLKG